MSDAVLGESLSKLVGDKTAKALRTGLGLETVGELLRHYPRRYYARGELTSLRELVPGEQATVQARIVKVTGRRLRPKLYKTDVEITDGRDTIVCTFFNKPWVERQLAAGTSALFAGSVERFRNANQLTNPEVQVGEDADSFANALTPIYPATAALPTWKIAQCVRVALDSIGDLDEADDPLPADMRARLHLLGLSEALQLIHVPEQRADVTRAQDRLRWDEAYVLQVVLAQRRAATRRLPAKPRIAAPDGLLARFDQRLPFTLTDGQREIGETLTSDLARTFPMNRLLQGEVGSGKTVVALRAMLAVVDAGGQAALLAPTEVLAQQHARTLRSMLGPLAEGGFLGGAEHAMRVELLTGSQSTGVRRATLLAAASGDAGIVVGTHALLQEHVQFFDLGLVVVDEQHRFGVEQRDALRAKAANPPHVLVMTATPIPRTVAMTVFGDLEVSTLSELPEGRSAIATHVVPVGEKPHFLERAWQRVREEVAKGHQAYVVCPRIGDGSGQASEDGEEPPPEDGSRRPPLAVTDIAPMLAEGPLAGLRLEVLHGKLPPETKDDVMSRFSAGDIDVLVATTVIEVGVDVPRATAMVVLDADRFGVSQLHQLRGRVGRGAAAGICLLVTDAEPGSPSRERLDAVAGTLDGFELARLDLEQRREGDVLGASQSGRRSSLRLLGVVRDEELIRAARDEATALVASDPELDGQPALRAAIASLLDADRADYLEKA